MLFIILIYIFPFLIMFDREDVFDISNHSEESAIFDEKGMETDEVMQCWNVATVMGRFAAHMNHRRLSDMKDYLDYTASMTGRGSSPYDKTVILREKEKLRSANW